MKIALVCTGTRADSVDEVEQTAHLLEQYPGWQIVFDSCLAEVQTPEQRAAHLLQYLNNPTIDLIWAQRGGEGTADIIPYLTPHLSHLKQLKPKTLVGFSDFTCLLLYFRQHLHWPVIHAPVARQWFLQSIDETTRTSVQQWLNTRTPFHIPNLQLLNPESAPTTSITGYTTGGNLSLLSISLKDKWEIDCKDRIVLIEEINEKPHKINRALKHLQRVGIFEGANALVLAGCNFDNPINQKICDPSTQELLQGFAKSITTPVFYTDQIGHLLTNYPVPFDTLSRIELQQPTIANWYFEK